MCDGDGLTGTDDTQAAADNDLADARAREAAEAEALAQAAEAEATRMAALMG